MTPVYRRHEPREQPDDDDHRTSTSAQENSQDLHCSNIRTLITGAVAVAGEFQSMTAFVEISNSVSE